MARSDQVRETPGGESWAMAATEASVISSLATSGRRGSYTNTIRTQTERKYVSHVARCLVLEA